MRKMAAVMRMLVGAVVLMAVIMVVLATGAQIVDGAVRLLVLVSASALAFLPAVCPSSS